MFIVKFYNNQKFRVSCLAETIEEARTKIKETGVDMDRWDWTVTLEEVIK